MRREPRCRSPRGHRRTLARRDVDPARARRAARRRAARAPSPPAPRCRRRPSGGRRTAVVLPLGHDLRQRLERSASSTVARWIVPRISQSRTTSRSSAAARARSGRSRRARDHSPIVRRHGLLGLEPDEVLDHVLHRHVGAAEQVLPLQQRAVQRTTAEDLGAQSTSLRVIARIAMRHIRIPKPTRKPRWRRRPSRPSRRARRRAGAGRDGRAG